MNSENLIKLLSSELSSTPSWWKHRRQVLSLAIETLISQQKQYMLQQEVIGHLKLQLSHLQEHSASLNVQVNQWHKLADERSGEIVRLLGEIEAMRKKEES